MKPGFTRRYAVVCAAVGWLVAGGLAPPAQAALPGEAHVCGDEIDHSFMLLNDLTGAGCDDKSGLIIKADNIVIDLNFHLIENFGAPDTDEHGIDGSETHSGVTIKNGTIRNYYRGVFLFGGTGNRVEKVVAAANVDNGIHVNGTSHVITKSFAVANGNFGIEADQPDGVQITNNTAAQNAFQGINVGTGKKVKITGNNVSGNGDTGITVANSEGNIIQKNTVVGNGNFGIGMNFADTGTKISKNVVNGNENIGIFVIDGNAVDISKNVVYATGYANQTSNGVGLAVDASGVDPAGLTGKGTRVFGGDTFLNPCDPGFLCVLP